VVSATDLHGRVLQTEAATFSFNVTTGIGLIQSWLLIDSNP
jgi:hypothetical protein